MLVNIAIYFQQLQGFSSKGFIGELNLVQTVTYKITIHVCIHAGKAKNCRYRVWKDMQAITLIFISISSVISCIYFNTACELVNAESNL